MRPLLRAALLSTLLLAASAAATTPEENQAMYLNAVRLMNEGRTQEARAIFERLIALEPHNAGAVLELALIQCAQGEAAEAEKLFRDIEVRFAPSATILEVMNAHRRQGCKPWQAQSLRSITLARGTDSNVNQGASNPVFITGSGPDRIESELDEDFLPKRDDYNQATFDYTRELGRRGGVALAQVRVRRHDTLSDQDTNALLLGVDQPYKVLGWNGRALLSTSAVTLGGHLYQRQLQLQARLMPPVKLPESLDLTLAASMGKVDYVTREHFDSATGELSAQLSFRGDHTQAQLSAGVLGDHGDAERLGGNRHGNFRNLQVQHSFSDRFQGELGWTQQNWRGQTVYARDLIDTVRVQSTGQWRGALAWQVSKEQRWQLEWRHVRNRENISLFQYNSQVLQLNWRWTGF